MMVRQWVDRTDACFLCELYRKKLNRGVFDGSIEFLRVTVEFLQWFLDRQSPTTRKRKLSTILESSEIVHRQKYRIIHGTFGLTTVLFACE